MAVRVISIFEGAYDAHIRLAADKLRDGGVVVLPTETVYAASASLDRAEALPRLRQLGGGATGEARPFVPHLAQPGDAARFLGDISEFGQRCICKLWPG